jgi:hypothetical protein
MNTQLLQKRIDALRQRLTPEAPVILAPIEGGRRWRAESPGGQQRTFATLSEACAACGDGPIIIIDVLL